MAAVAPSEAATTELYLYGVVAAGSLHGVDAEGIGGSAVTMLESGPLAALVSPVAAAGLRFKRRDLDRHLAVLAAAFEQTAILPYAFGTVASSREAVAEMLGGDGSARLLEALERLAGHVQLNVKATYDEREVLAEIVRGDAETRRLRDATRRLGTAAHYEQIRLGERVAAAIEGARQRDAERLAAALERLAADLDYDEASDLTVLKVSLLVHRDELARVEQALERIARDESPRIGLEAVGPLPPTAFASRYAAE
jgi:hypothetical protein